MDKGLSGAKLKWAEDQTDETTHQFTYVRKVEPGKYEYCEQIFDLDEKRLEWFEYDSTTETVHVKPQEKIMPGLAAVWLNRKRRLFYWVNKFFFYILSKRDTHRYTGEKNQLYKPLNFALAVDCILPKYEDTIVNMRLFLERNTETFQQIYVQAKTDVETEKEANKKIIFASPPKLIRRINTSKNERLWWKAVENKVIVMQTFRSTSPGILSDWSSTNTCFEISTANHTKGFRYIRKWSQLPHECEVLFSPGSKFKVTSVNISYDDRVPTQIHLTFIGIDDSEQGNVLEECMLWIARLTVVGLVTGLVGFLYKRSGLFIESRLFFPPKTFT